MDGFVGTNQKFADAPVGMLQHGNPQICLSSAHFEAHIKAKTLRFLRSPEMPFIVGLGQAMFYWSWDALAQATTIICPVK
jgi:hypothetical protein